MVKYQNYIITEENGKIRIRNARKGINGGMCANLGRTSMIGFNLESAIQT